MAGIFDFFPKQGSGGVLPASDPGEAQSLALLNAMGPIGQAGTTRTAGPVGSIAQNLIPVLGAMIQAKALQAQSQQQAQTQDLQKQYLLAKIAGAGGNPDMQAAKLEKTKAETELTQARTKAVGQPKPTGGMSDNQILAAALQGDPLAQAMREQKQADAVQKLQLASGLTAQRTVQLQDEAAQRKEARRLESTASAAPEYRNKTIFDRNTLTSPTGVSVRDLESPNSSYVALDRNDAKIVKGAKVVSQQLDRLEQLIPEVLPETRWGIPNTLTSALFADKPSAKAAELDRLSEFEQMTGIKDFIAGRGPNQAEIHNIGKINRYTDSRATAQAKIDAMRQLLGNNLAAFDLNPDSIMGKKAQGQDPNFIPTPQSQEISTMIGGLLEQGKSKEEIRRAVQAYQISHPGTKIDADLR